jgi:hypothetical protein
MRKLADDIILTREVIDSLDLGGRAHNVVINNFEGCSVAELRAAMADRRRPILHCGAVTIAEITDALNGVPRPITPAALARKAAQIKAEADARIARLYRRAHQHVDLGWRP